MYVSPGWLVLSVDSIQESSPFACVAPLSRTSALFPLSTADGYWMLASYSSTQAAVQTAATGDDDRNAARSKEKKSHVRGYGC